MSNESRFYPPPSEFIDRVHVSAVKRPDLPPPNLGVGGGVSAAKKDNVKDCKPPIKYVHHEVFTGTAFGMLAGEIKYDAWNFIKGHDRQDLVDGAIRHLLDFRRGIDVDADTTARLAAKYGNKAPQIKHLWLALCNINMLLWQAEAGTSRNSYPQKGDK
jgi:hypothetical protein